MLAGAVGHGQAAVPGHERGAAPEEGVLHVLTYLQAAPPDQFPTSDRRAVGALLRRLLLEPGLLCTSWSLPDQADLLSGLVRILLAEICARTAAVAGLCAYLAAQHGAALLHVVQHIAGQQVASPEAEPLARVVASILRCLKADPAALPERLGVCSELIATLAALGQDPHTCKALVETGLLRDLLDAFGPALIPGDAWLSVCLALFQAASEAVSKYFWEDLVSTPSAAGPEAGKQLAQGGVVLVCVCSFAHRVPANAIHVRVQMATALIAMVYHPDGIETPMLSYFVNGMGPDFCTDCVLAGTEAEPAVGAGESPSASPTTPELAAGILAFSRDFLVGVLKGAGQESGRPVQRYSAVVVGMLLAAYKHSRSTTLDTTVLSILSSLFGEFPDLLAADRPHAYAAVCVDFDGRSRAVQDQVFGLLDVLLSHRRVSEEELFGWEAVCGLLRNAHARGLPSVLRHMQGLLNADSLPKLVRARLVPCLMAELSRVAEGFVDTDCSFFGYVDCDTTIQRHLLAEEAEDLLLQLFGLLHFVVTHSEESRAAFQDRGRVRLLLHFVQGVRLRGPALQILTTLGCHDVAKEIPLLGTLLGLLRHVRIGTVPAGEGRGNNSASGGGDSALASHVGLFLEDAGASRSASETDLSDISPATARREARREHPVMSLNAVFTLWQSIGSILQANRVTVLDFVENDGFNCVVHGLLQLGRHARAGPHVVASELIEVVTIVFRVLRQCLCSGLLEEQDFSLSKLRSACRQSRLMQSGSLPQSLLCDLLVELGVNHGWTAPSSPHVLLGDGGDEDGSAADHGLIVRPAFVLEALKLAGHLQDNPGGSAQRALHQFVVGLEELIAAAAENPHVLSQHGALTVILERLHTPCEDDRHPAHAAVLRLVETVGSHTITEAELRAYLQFFRSGWPPLGLTNTLLRMTSSAQSPQAFARFGARCGSHGHIEAHLPNVTWPPTHVYTITLWLRYDACPRAEGDIPIFRLSSITKGLNDSTATPESGAGDSASTSLGLDPRSGTLTLAQRVDDHAIAARFDAFALPAGSWQHIVITHRSTSSKFRKALRAGQATLFVNGLQRQSLDMGYQTAYFHSASLVFNPPTDSRPGYTAPLGDDATHAPARALGARSSWQLGNVGIFKFPFDQGSAMRLFALGPEVPVLNGVEEAPLASLTPRVVAEFLDAGLSGSQILANLAPSASKQGSVSGSLIMLFRPRDFCAFSASGGKAAAASTPPTRSQAGSATVSPAGTPPRPQRSGDVPEAAVHPAEPPNRTKAMVLATGVEPVAVLHTDGVEAARRRDVRVSVPGVGGMSVFLYLLARCAPCATHQAAGVRLLLAVLRYPHNAREMCQVEGYLLLQHFLLSARCVVSAELSCALLEAACGDGRACLGPGRALSEDAVVVDVALVRVLVNWRVWERALPRAWVNLTAALILLVDKESNQHAAFNALQFRRAGAVDSILFACQEERLAFPGQVTLNYVRLLFHIMSHSADDDSEGAQASTIDDADRLVKFLVASHETKNVDMRETNVSFREAKSTKHNKRFRRGDYTTRARPRSNSISGDMNLSLAPQGIISGPRRRRIASTSLLDPHLSDFGADDLFEDPAAAGGAADGDSTQGGGGGEYPVTSSPVKSGRPLASAPMSPVLADQPERPRSLPPFSTPLLFSEDRGEGQGVSPGALGSGVRGGSAFAVPTPDSSRHWLRPSQPGSELSTMLSGSGHLADLLANKLPDFRLDSSFMGWWHDAEATSEDVSVRVGMLGLLLEKVHGCPEALVPDLQKVFSVDTLLTFANHGDLVTRMVVVRLLDALFRLDLPAFHTLFASMQGFHVLASQLRQHPPSDDLFNACCDLLTGQTTRPDDVFPDDLGLVDTTGYAVRDRNPKYPGQPGAAVVMLALLHSVSHLPFLCMRMLGTARKIFQRRADLRVPLLESNLVATLCDVVAHATDHEDASSPSPPPQPAPADGGRSASPGGEGQSSFTGLAAEDSFEDINLSVSLLCDEGEGGVASARAIVVAIESFLVDMVRGICELHMGTAAKLLEDVVDCLASWRMPPFHAKHLQRIVLQTVLDQSVLHVVRFCAESEEALPSICTLAVDLAVFSPDPAPVPDTDRDAGAGGPAAPEHYGYKDGFGFVCQLFHILRRLVTEARVPQSAREAILGQLGRLVVHLLSSTQTKRLHGNFILSNLNVHPELLQALNTSAGTHVFLSAYEFYCRNAPPGGDPDSLAIAHALLKRVVELQPELVRACIDVEGSVLGKAGRWHLQVYGSVRVQEQDWKARELDQGRDWLVQRARAKQERITRAMQLDSLVATDTVDLTTSTIRQHSAQRLEGLRRLQRRSHETARVQTRWSQLCAAVTHARATCSAWGPSDADTTWMLDPTEGPARMRLRMKPFRIPGAQSFARTGSSAPDGDGDGGGDGAAVGSGAEAGGALRAVGADEGGTDGDGESEGEDSGGLESSLLSAASTSPLFTLRANGSAPNGGGQHAAQRSSSSSSSSSGPEGATRRKAREAFERTYALVDRTLQARQHPGLAALSVRSRAAAAKSVCEELRREGPHQHHSGFGGASDASPPQQAPPARAVVQEMAALGLFKRIPPAAARSGRAPHGTRPSPSVLSGDPADYLCAGGDVALEPGGLQPGDQITLTAAASVVTPFLILGGELLLGTHNLYFKEDPSVVLHGTGSARKHLPSVLALGAMARDPLQLPYFPFRLVKEIHPRRYLLQRNALEVFFSNGETLFLAFPSTRVRDEVERDLVAKCDEEYIDYGDSLEGSLLRDSITTKWCRGHVSNFEYLMHLNKLAGRTFNDLTQYPVFPCILRDFTSDTLDLASPAAFRDLSKPMGAQSAERLSKFLQKYRDLEDMDEPPYLYGSHYSNVGGVLHFLTRVEPFTQLSLELQSGKFDVADRMFHDFAQTWRLSAELSTADVKELVPECFCLPEMLINRNRNEFGRKQDGELVDDVRLPPWAEGDPRRFIALHREALESEHVSLNLHHWIDLIFGHKQEGKAAKEAHNLFLPLSYEGAIDISATSDPVQREAQWSIVRSFGQTPRRLFHRPHPARSVAPAEAPVFTRHLLDQGLGVAWHRKLSEPVHSVAMLPDGTVFALGPDQRMLGGAGASQCVLWNAWDDALRICHFEGFRELCVLRTFPADPVCVVHVCPAGTHLIAGHASGAVAFYEVHHSRKTCTATLRAVGHGHRGPVTAIEICVEFAVVVTASTDRSAILWDLNSCAFVRAMEGHEAAVSAVAVGPSTGDIVTACQAEPTSGAPTATAAAPPGRVTRLRLWTVNARHEHSAQSTDPLLCLALTPFPPGVNPNVVLAGSQRGRVHVFDAHDLSRLCELCDPRFNAPVRCLGFTPDFTAVLVGDEEGRVVCWKNASRGRGQFLQGRGLSSSLIWRKKGAALA